MGPHAYTKASTEQMFEDIHEYMIQRKSMLQSAGSCTVVNGTVHPDRRSVDDSGGPSTGYRYYDSCPFVIKQTCPANYYPITPSMECGVVGAIVPDLESP